ncbi:beta strand repeat-containing protein [Luteolibacter soli]|uniref:Autotransporter-associated beta strand repeat-containing protein n=1 Tax=Luteolibacter soli TaxID=3135280 RepID=A0ABU9AUA1_9BACT
MKPNKPKSIHAFLANVHTRSNLLRLGALLITATTAGAANLYWDTNGTATGSGTSTGGDWEGVNWNTNSAGTTTVPGVWVDGSTAVFSAGTNATGSFTINLNSTVSAPAILFEEITAGNNRTFNGNGTINIGGGTITSTAFGAGTSGNNGTDVNFNVVLAGSGGLTIAAHGNHITNGGGGGGSELRLNANNTFTGGLTITSGLVSWNNDAHLGDPSNIITLNGGGSLNTGALHTTTRTFRIGTNGGTFRLYGSTVLLHSGTIVNAPGATNPTLRRTDGGTFRMLGSISGFTGTWLNGGGTTEAAVPNADWSNTNLQLEGGNFTFNGTGTAVVNAIQGNTDVYFDYGTTANVDTGAITLTGGGNWRTNLGSLGKLTSSTGTLTFASGAASGSLSTSNPSMQVTIANSGATPVALVKNNVGNLVLAQQNTYTGGTTINAGRLDATHPGAFGSGSVTVNSGGQLFLSWGAPYSTPVTINGNGPTEGTSFGALRLGNPAVLSGALTVGSASRIGVNSNEIGTISGSVTGSAALEKTGLGVLSLTGNMAGYSGAVTVSQGSLNVATTLPGSVSAADGAVIAGEGSVGGLTLGTSAGAGIAIDGSTAGALTTTNLTTTGLTSVRLLSNPAVFGTPIPVINYSGTLSLPGPASSSFDLQNAAQYRGVPAFNDTGSAITLTIPAGANLVWAGTNVLATWDNGVSADWSNGGGADVFYAGDNVLFNDSAANKTVVMSGMLSPAMVTFDNSTGNDYNITPNGGGLGFTGPTSIVKNGTGTATIQGFGHNYTGTVTINGGVLQGNGNYELLGNSSGVFVNNGGQLNVNGLNFGNGTRHYTMTIAGAGANGLGAITNSSTNSPNENAGILHLKLSDNASVGGSGGRYDIGRSGGAFGTVNGNGFTVTKVGSNTICFRAPATNINFVCAAGTLKMEDSDTAFGSNSVTVTGGTLQAYGYRIIANPVDFAATTTLDSDGGGNQRWTGPFNLSGAAATTMNVNARSGVITLDNVISGTGDLTSIGGNQLILTGGSANTMTGAVRVTGTGQLILSKTANTPAIPGDLYLSNTGSRPIVSMTADNQFGANSVIHFNGTNESRIELKGTTQTVAGLDYPAATAGFKAIQHSEYGSPSAVDAVSDLIINVANGNTFAYSADLRDQGGTVNVVKNGTGTQSLLGNGIDYRGTTTVNAGTLISNGDDIWTSVLTIASGAVFDAHITSTTELYEHMFGGSVINGAGIYRKSGPGTSSFSSGNGLANVSMASGALIDITEGMIRLDYGGNNNWTNNKADMNIASGASFNLWDNTGSGPMVDALTGEGNVTRTNYAETGNLTVGVDNGSGDFAGSISNTTGKTHLIKNGTGTQTLSGFNTYSGNTTINGGAVVLTEFGWLSFFVGNGTTNSVGGTGSFTANGTFIIDTSAVTANSGTWNLVNTSSLTESFGATFSILGWTEAGNVWTYEDGNKTWTFTEATGNLELVSENTYATWIDGFFTGQSDQNIIGPDADPDHDGITNAIEMVVGGNPATGVDVNLQPTIELVTNPAGVPAGDYLLFTYRRTDLSVLAGVIASSEYDTNLIAPWTVAQNGVGGVTILVDDNYASFTPPATDTDRVRVFVPRAANAKLFGRLNATVP